MSGNAEFESRIIEALRHYREALATVESLEREKDSAHRALTGMLPDFERALLEEDALSPKHSLFETGSAAVSRWEEARAAFNQASAKLDSARVTLATLEQLLSYLPEPR
jgi:multidrug resistance efflux pump